MKKILFFLLIVGVACMIQAQEKVSYKPFFGKDSTMQYYYSPVDNGFIVDQYPYLCQILGPIEKSKWLFYLKSAVSVSEDNSKMWDITDTDYTHDSILLVDLNLAVGDSFEIVRGTKNFVTKVYWENELKHIQFDLSFFVSADTLNEGRGDDLHLVSYEMVEGVGSLYPEVVKDWFYWIPYPEDTDLYYGGVTVRGIWRDGSPFYIHKLWERAWNYGALDDSALKDIRGDEVAVFYEGDRLLWVTVSDSYNESRLEICDLAGTVFLSDSFVGSYSYSLSSLPQGVYVVKVNNYTTKILLL